MDGMKVLIAEDDRDSAKLLRRYVQDAGHDVIMADDGNQTWKVLQREDAPKLAVLDWIMPGMSGVDICKALRAKRQNLRTYAIIITAKGKKKDVIEGLDSGADDFLVKPVDKGELLARLRVAERTIRLQERYVQVIDQQESLLRRHDLLGELVWKLGHSNQNSRGVNSDLSDDLHQAHKYSLGGESRALSNMGHFLVGLLNEIGFAMTSSLASRISSANQNLDFSSWCALIVKGTGMWLDVKIESDRNTAGELFYLMSGKEGKSDTHLLDAMSELANMYVENLKMALKEEGIDALRPYIAKAMYTRAVPARIPLGRRREQHILSGSGHVVRLTVIEYPVQVLKKAIARACCLDVLAEPVYQSAGTDLLLLNEGAALDYQYISKLHDFLGANEKQIPISVLEPSPLTLIFNRAHERFSEMYVKR